MKILVAAAVLVVSAVVPAHAGTRTHAEFVLTGDSSASVEVRLDRGIELQCCRYVSEEADGRLRFRIAGLEAETDGTFAGFAIERPRDGRLLWGVVRLPAMDLDEGSVPGFASFGRQRRLPPGRYRVHLLTDGPSTVRVAAFGLRRDVHLRPEGPTDVTASLVELAGQDLQQRVPVGVPRDATVVLVSKTEGDLTQAHYSHHCLVAPGGHCSDPEDHDVFTTPASGGGGMTNVDSFHGPPAGSYEAVFAARSFGLPQGSYGFVLVLG